MPASPLGKPPTPTIPATRSGACRSESPRDCSGSLAGIPAGSCLKTIFPATYSDSSVQRGRRKSYESRAIGAYPRLCLTFASKGRWPPNENCSKRRWTVERITSEGPPAMSDSDIVKDFLVESYENLDRLDRDLVGLEKNPHDRDALAGVFRTIHTIKGTCGFLGFSKLEKVAHVGENLLTRLPDGQLTLNPELTTALLGMVDAVRQMLKEIQATGQDGEVDYPELRENLTRLQQVGAVAAKPVGAAESPAHQEVEPPAPGKSITLADANEMELSPPPSEPAKPAATKRPKAAKIQPTQEAISARPVEPVPVHAEEPGLAKREDVTAAQQSLESKHRDTAAETIRVGVTVLDKLMTL